MIIRIKPPTWFWVVAGLLLLWGIVGVIGFQMTVAMTPADYARMPPYDRQLYASQPTWVTATYGMATWTGLLGTILLLARKVWARPLYFLSLAGVIVLFGWTFVMTDIIAVKGVVSATGFPVVIALIAIFEIWLAGLARARGWIG